MTRPADPRSQAIRAFARHQFGLRGTLRLHRAALGWDLLRAPINVLLAPVFLLTRILAWLTRLARWPAFSAWLSTRRIFLETAVAAQVDTAVTAFIADLDHRGIGPDATPDRVRAEIADYTATRGAVAEMVTTLLVLLSGYLLFSAATPGIISLAGPMAELRARSTAIDSFALGPGLGRLYYGVFPTALSPWFVLGTGVVLAMLGSLVTTFAGLLADPLQVATGTHRRRLDRLLTRLDAASDSGLALEHVLARMGDLSDMALSLWRMIRG